MDIPTILAAGTVAAEPAKMLITRVFDFIDRQTEPRRIVRVAEANRKAAMIDADTDIEVQIRRQRELRRLAAEVIRSEEALEATTIKSIEDLDPTARPDRIADDWLHNFLQKAKEFTDEDMQTLWGRILAGESNNPGSFSRRTVNLLSDMGPEDAALFTAACGFLWEIDGRPTLAILSHGVEPFESAGMKFDNLYHLESLGLMHYAWDTHFNVGSKTIPAKATYFGTSLKIHPKPGPASFSIHVGKAKLTRAGAELARIYRPVAVPGVFEYMRQFWEKSGLIVEDFENQN